MNSVIQTFVQLVLVTQLGVDLSISTRKDDAIDNLISRHASLSCNFNSMHHCAFDVGSVADWVFYRRYRSIGGQRNTLSSSGRGGSVGQRMTQSSSSPDLFPCTVKSITNGKSMKKPSTLSLTLPWIRTTTRSPSNFTTLCVSIDFRFQSIDSALLLVTSPIESAVASRSRRHADHSSASIDKHYNLIVNNSFVPFRDWIRLTLPIAPFITQGHPTPSPNLSFDPVKLKLSLELLNGVCLDNFNLNQSSLTCQGQLQVLSSTNINHLNILLHEVTLSDNEALTRWNRLLKNDEALKEENEQQASQELENATIPNPKIASAAVISDPTTSSVMHANDSFDAKPFSSPTDNISELKERSDLINLSNSVKYKEDYGRTLNKKLVSASLTTIKSVKHKTNSAPSGDIFDIKYADSIVEKYLVPTELFDKNEEFENKERESHHEHRVLVSTLKPPLTALATETAVTDTIQSNTVTISVDTTPSPSDSIVEEAFNDTTSTTSQSQHHYRRHSSNKSSLATTKHTSTFNLSMPFIYFIFCMLVLILIFLLTLIVSILLPLSRLRNTTKHLHKSSPSKAFRSGGGGIVKSNRKLDPSLWSSSLSLVGASDENSNQILHSLSRHQRDKLNRLDHHQHRVAINNEFKQAVAASLTSGYYSLVSSGSFDKGAGSLLHRIDLCDLDQRNVHPSKITLSSDCSSGSSSDVAYSAVTTNTTIGHESASSNGRRQPDHTSQKRFASSPSNPAESTTSALQLLRNRYLPRGRLMAPTGAVVNAPETTELGITSIRRKTSMSRESTTKRRLAHHDVLVNSAILGAKCTPDQRLQRPSRLGNGQLLGMSDSMQPICLPSPEFKTDDSQSQGQQSDLIDQCWWPDSISANLTGG